MVFLGLRWLRLREVSVDWWHQHVYFPGFFVLSEIVMSCLRDGMAWSCTALSSYIFSCTPLHSCRIVFSCKYVLGMYHCPCKCILLGSFSLNKWCSFVVFKFLYFFVRRKILLYAACSWVWPCELWAYSLWWFYIREEIHKYKDEHGSMRTRVNSKFEKILERN